MLAFRDRRFQGRIESIAREEGQDSRLTWKVPLGLIMIAECLETCNAANGLAAARLNMVDIVVVEQTQIWRSLFCARAVCDGL